MLWLGLAARHSFVARTGFSLVLGVYETSAKLFMTTQPQFASFFPRIYTWKFPLHSHHQLRRTYVLPATNSDVHSESAPIEDRIMFCLVWKHMY
jgi:hypothetical protein